MKRKPVSVAVAAVVAGLTLSSAHAGVVKTEGEDIIVSTKNGGLALKTEDGAFSFKVSGKLQWDYASLDDLYVADSGNDAEARKGYIRRAEIGFSGKAYSDWKYKLKLKTKSDDSIELDDAKISYVGFKPVEVTLGRWGRDYGLENTVSSSWIMAIERPMMYDFLQGDEGNDYGIQVATGGDNYTAVFGIHHDGQAEEDKPEVERTASYVLRATYAPIMNDDMLLHLGLNYYNKNPDGGSDVELESSLGAKKGADRTVTVANVDKDSEYVLELAGQFQSLQLQGEYAVRDMKSKNANSDAKVSGYYGQISYMLDGGKRTYKEGAFGKPTGGQWEVFARYTQATIDQDSVSDDLELKTTTLGVNYFATKNIRASLNYVQGKTNENIENDKGSAIVSRLQYVF
ncbi:OprO/OprP family phosphate-selective porin [Endozoicomonas sp. SESOKO2]|uniref:OprO/OprP family phosphate-selective porin n=1 Tax=Endozoicomonas sp. SESOKO2 TaxID=2828743 RepID=UPI0021487BD7|nr:porin [Endozoicomonas sp. SESOKO2]